MDGDLDKWVFAFDIHLQDKDRDQTQITDRQRNEILDLDNLKGIEGEKVVYRWKFRLPEGMKATSSFTHIHQLKGVGGNDIGMPLITLTVRKKSNGNQIELIYVPPKEDPGGQGNDYLATVPFADFEGEWVEATETVTYGYDTNYSMSITRIRDGKRLLFYSGKRDMWRTGATMIRPKWGIYRSIGDNGNKKTELRDERLLFADFEVEEPADE